MSDEENSKDEENVDTLAVDEHTTEPQADAPDKWEMPEPVFQQTSGYLPQGFVKQIENAAQDEATAETPAQPAAIEQPAAIPAAPTAPLPAIGPQPDISEQFAIDELPVEPPVAAKTKSGALRIVFIVLGLLAFLVFMAVFLVLVYFLFLAAPAPNTNF